MRWSTSPARPGGTVTMRSAVRSLLYGSAGCSRVGGSLIDASEGLGTGVEVTPEMKPVTVDPTPPATIPRPPAPTQRTPTPSVRTAATSTRRITTGRPRLRRMGRWVDRRVGPGDRGFALTGAGRPLDGGRGLTWACRESRRVVIARIVPRVRKSDAPGAPCRAGDAL